MADAHLHFFSHHFFTTLISSAASQKPGLTLEAAGEHLGWALPPQAPEKLAEVWVHELDRHGVFASALIGSVPGDEDSVAAAVRAFPDRFFAYAMVNPRALPAGLPATFSEVRVACLFPAMHGYSIQDDCARPVFEWAQAHRRAVFVHCGVLSVGVRKKLGLSSPFDMRFSNPVDLDTSSSNQWMRYQAGHITLREVFRHALDVAGAHRLLFGTDSSFFPRGWHHAIFEDQAKALYEIGTSEADARAIFGENLLRILAV